MVTAISYRVSWNIAELAAYARFCLWVLLLLACVLAAPMVVAWVLPLIVAALPWLGCACLIALFAIVTKPRGK